MDDFTEEELRALEGFILGARGGMEVLSVRDAELNIPFEIEFLRSAFDKLLKLIAEKK